MTQNRLLSTGAALLAALCLLLHCPAAVGKSRFWISPLRR